MTAETALPRLWGITPDTKWQWTPAEFRVDPEGWAAGVEAERARIKADPAGDKDGKKWEKALDGLLEKFRYEPSPIKEGAPIFDIAALPEGLAFQIQSAQSVGRQILNLANAELQSSIDKIKASSATEDEKESQIAIAERKARRAYVQEAEMLFDAKMIASVLAACVKGWTGMVKEFTGDWSKDSQVMPVDWKLELFRAIRDGSAYSESEQAGFTLPRASSPG